MISLYSFLKWHLTWSLCVVSYVLSLLLKFHYLCYQVNHKLPRYIFVFRDGVGDGQLRMVKDFEVPQLSECFANFGADYCPKLVVIVVQKRINQRIFVCCFCL